MSQDGDAWANSGAFDVSFTFDTTDESLPHYAVDLTPGIEDTWLSAFMAEDEVLPPNPNNCCSPRLDGNLTSHDPDNRCNASADLIDPILQASSSNGLSTDQWDLPPNLLYDELWGCLNTIATSQELAATNANPIALEQESLHPSEKKSLKRFRSRKPGKRSTSGHKKYNRTKISSEVRIMLDAHFNGNPYPTDGELTLLSGKARLPIPVIRRWFMNARSRKQPLHGPGKCGSDYQDLNQNDPPHALLSQIDVPNDSSRDPDRFSPAPSASSLERYLSAATDQEAVPAATIEAALQGDFVRPSPDFEQLDRSTHSAHGFIGSLDCNTCQLNRFSCSRDLPVCRECAKGNKRCSYGESELRAGRDSSAKAMKWGANSRQPSPMRSFNVMGSDSSVGSNNSYGSLGSLLSVDSRASRRGRKRWGRPQIPSAFGPRPVSPSTFECFLDSGESRESHIRTPYFCTSADCNLSFRNRYEWARHEEAVHHWPYHWICCLDIKTVMRLPHCFVCGEADVLLSHLTECQLESCATRSEESRTFVREDQLAQHMKRLHINETSPKLPIPKALLSAWKIYNPSLPVSSLHCGFCGMTFDTWRERQDHVFDHLKHGVCKSAWWPGRLPNIPTSFSR